MTVTRSLGAGLVLALCAACARDSAPTAGPQEALASGIDLSGFDASVRPGDDFHAYVNGGWIARTPIPADRNRYGVSTMLVEQAEADLRAILEEAAAAQAPAGSEAAKIGDFYASFMDAAAIESRGVAALDELLARIDAIDSIEALVAYFARSMREGIQAPQQLFIFPDLGNSSRYIAYFAQDGLGLPDRDFYLRDEERFQKVRAAYPGYIARLFALAGIDGGEARAQAIYALEGRIAEAHWPAEDVQDLSKIYNMYDIERLSELGATLDWADYLGRLGLADQSELVVAEPSYHSAFARLLAEVPLQTWKDYATFKALAAAAPYLSADFVEAQFEFDGRIVNGLESQPERWKRAVRLLDGAMGEAVGRIYVERHFPPEAKARMDQLVANLLAAFGEGIDALDWMSEATKARAHEKLAKFTPKIGYPEQWRNYSALRVERADLIGNILRANEFEYRRNVDKLGGPIDRTEWGMTPQTVNAYYDPTKNEIVFPAAILQPPYFDVAADDAVNYGAIGAIIGHEISHGFDDQGSKFDGDGNMHNWWGEADRATFDALGEQLIEQFNAYEPLPGMHVNGKLTLGENIGDLSGLAVAYRAYRMSLQGEEPPVIDGITGDQRFFLGYAQGWRHKMRDELMIQRLVADPHSPPEYRVNGIVRNFDPWYAAFDVGEGDALYLPPAERVSIW